MGWQDAPEVAAAPKWAAAPEVSDKPGMLKRALTWASTPFAGVQPLLEQQRKAAALEGPPIINRVLGIPPENEPDALTGAKKFVSGIPGAAPLPQDESPREARFREQHPALNILLPMAGGFTGLAPAPEVSGAPGVVERTANSLAARTLRGTAGEYKQLGDEGVQGLGDFLLRNRAVRFGSSPASVAERARDLPDVTGKALSGAIEALDATGGQVSKTGLAQQFQSLADEARAGGPGAAPLVAKYEKAAADVLADVQSTGKPSMSFQEAEQWKRAYQAPINYAKSSNTPLEMGSKEIASAARQAVEEAASQAGPGSSVAEQFLSAKRESGLAQQAAKMAEGADGRRMGRNMISPSGVATSLAAATGALASGHPAGVIPGLVAGPLLQLIRERAPASAAVLLKSMAPGVGRSIAQDAPVELSTLLREIAARRRSVMSEQLASNE